MVDFDFHPFTVSRASDVMIAKDFSVSVFQSLAGVEIKAEEVFS